MKACVCFRKLACAVSVICGMKKHRWCIDASHTLTVPAVVGTGLGARKANSYVVSTLIAQTCGHDYVSANASVNVQCSLFELQVSWAGGLLCGFCQFAVCISSVCQRGRFERGPVRTGVWVVLYLCDRCRSGFKHRRGCFWSIHSSWRGILRA
jgi:hypothetical protein